MLHGGPSLFGYMHTHQKHYAMLECANLCTTWHHRQSVSPENITIESHFEDLDGLIAQHKQGRPVILIGHSWGADLALFMLRIDRELSKD